MLTMYDVSERLKKLDEVTLLEVLEISAEDIVDRFQDLIEDNLETLQEELADEE